MQIAMIHVIELSEMYLNEYYLILQSGQVNYKCIGEMKLLKIILSFIDIIKLMSSTKQLYSKAKQALEKVAQGNSSIAIQLLQNVQKQVNHLKKNNPQLSDQLCSLQIITLNNLACAYQKKGKYKDSLYNLLKVSAMQMQKFGHLPQNEKTAEILHQIATTHSNLCTIYSEMNQHQKALQQIKISVDLMQNNPIEEQKGALIAFYYNYAIQLEYFQLYEESKQVIQRALSLMNKINKSKELSFLLSESLNRVEQKRKKKEMKLSVYFKRCLKGYYPSVKNIVQQANNKFNSRKNFSIDTIDHKSQTIDVTSSKNNKNSSYNFSMYKYQKKNTLYPYVHPKKLSPLKLPQSLQSQKTQNILLYRPRLQKIIMRPNKIKLPNQTKSFLKKQDQLNISKDQHFNYKIIL